MDTKIKAIIIDDETLGRQIIKKFLLEHEDIELIDECSNGFDGVKKINELKPDLVFLDIQMPKLNGFEMLELIDSPPVIIFTTAYDQYAIKAFEVNAADYLLKPFSSERFEEALGKAKLHLINKTEENNVVKELIKHTQESKEYLERIVIKDGAKIHIIPVVSVKYIEAQDDYVMIHSTEGNLLKQKTMKYFEEHLSPEDFLRVHRSYIVSIPHIKKIELLEKDTYKIILDDGDRLPVSKSGYENLRTLFK
ncbi:MAG TPA: LytTR family transcriptional regulator DNA-binding domain-containing protein [Ignavibacteriaceae bacterium]|nr:LytTR family transcriptional regulator DNA-binding domain-containing protein [Ignavibacteriaceae bacterium]